MIDYTEPSWSATPDSSLNFHFEILKSGLILAKTDPIDRPFSIIGRLPDCHFPLDHQSVSRHHAVLQFNQSDSSFYLFDLASTHGTFLNKERLKEKEYVKISIGDMIRFGQSTRYYVFLGPDNRVEQKQQHLKLIPKVVQKPEEFNWGFRDDAQEEIEGEEIPNDWKPDENAYYKKDPKKALKNWLDQRTMDFDIQYNEEKIGKDKGFLGSMHIVVEAGIDEVEAFGKGLSKKDAERECCLDACLKLDRLKVLRSESVRKEEQRLQNIFDDDSNDSFYDRTAKGPKQKVVLNGVETFHTLSMKKESIKKEQDDIINRLNVLRSNSKKNSTQDDEEEEEDSLDYYLNQMDNLQNSQQIETFENRQKELNGEMVKVEKLLKIVAPILPSFTITAAAPSIIKNPKEPTKVREEFVAPASKPVHHIAETKKVVEVNPSIIEEGSVGNNEESSDSLEVISIKTGGERKRNFITMTQEKSDEQLGVENDDVVDWVAPDEKQSEDMIKKLNEKYGY